jgi:hypothetical protein
MDPTLFVDTLPMPKGKWTVDTYTQLHTLCAGIEALLQQTGGVRLEGCNTPIDRLSYDGAVVTAESQDGGRFQVHVIGTLDKALMAALTPIVADQAFLAKGTTHSCRLGDGCFTALVDGRPYATLTIETKGASLSVLGLMPPWTFAFQGKPSKFEAHDGYTVVEKVLQQIKKEQPRFVLRDDATGQWYAGSMMDATNATVLTWVGAAQRAYAWTRQDDVLLHAMALEGLHASNWRTVPTAPGWAEAAKSTSDIHMTVQQPIAPIAFSVYRHDPRHGGVEEVVPATRFRALATIRRHQETVGVGPYGALACEVLAHIDRDAQGVDRFVAICDPSHEAPVREALAALGVPTRNNPAVRLAQKKGYHAHRPTVWSLALPQAAAEALVHQAQLWPDVAVAHHTWKDMWP